MEQFFCTSSVGNGHIWCLLGVYCTFSKQHVNCFPRKKNASPELHGTLPSECYSSLFIKKVSRTFNCFADS